MKKFQCPFCINRYYRNSLSTHINKMHLDELPENYTAHRMAYDVVNNKDGHGNCTECGRPTTWNEKTQKYNRLCGRKECYDKVKKTYETRMLKIYNKTHLLDDPIQQEKMLASRGISGQYKWSDGKMFTYTGQYEKQLLIYLDKGLNYDSNDILTPGPILEYEYDGKVHHWITDALIIPYNLIIEVKDGGNNPNNRSMPIYRAKQLAKETMITNLGTYSYIRLTNNEFDQLFNILAELKLNVINDDKDPLYRIHEQVFVSNIISDIQESLDPLSDIMDIELNSLYNVNESGSIDIGIVHPLLINDFNLNKINSKLNLLKEDFSHICKISISKQGKDYNLQLQI